MKGGVVMRYENGTQYSGTFAGIRINFSIENFSEKAVQRFNETRAEIALRKIKGEENADKWHRI